MSRLDESIEKLLKQIDDLGLIVHVDHKENTHGHRFKGEHGYLSYSHETCVELYIGQHWFNVNRDRELKKHEQYPRDLLTPVGIGFARCSVKDQFNRKIGRVIAMSRAIRSYINNEYKNR